MGCIASKHAYIAADALPSAAADKHAMQLYPSADWLVLVAAASEDHGKDCQSSKPAAPNAANHRTIIQDLPPHLIANILSRHSWVELFRSIPLVCKSWHQLTLSIVPEHLAFEFESAPTASNSKKPLHASVPGLRRFQSWRMQRQPHQPLQQQQQQQHQQQQQRWQHNRQQHCFVDSPALPLDEHTPWASWLKQHNSRLQHVSISIPATGPNCNADQYSVKEVVLNALAAGSNESGSSHHNGRAAGTTFLHGSIGIVCGSNPAVGVSKGPRSSSSSSTTGKLQLRSLELRLPLFEHDVQLIANSICSRAPALERLTLIGYTSSTASSNASTAQPVVPNQYIIQAALQQQQQQHPGVHMPHVAQHPAVQQGLPQAQQPVGQQGGAPNNASDNSSGEDQKNPSAQIIRQGFITGSSLQNLLTSASGLQSLTFACRQLYKASWLAPATQLTHLCLRDCQLGQQTLAELVGLRLPRLANLDLSCNPGLGTGSRASSSTTSSSSRCSGLDLIAKLTQLTRLDISGWDLSAVADVNSPHNASTARMQRAGARWSQPADVGAALFPQFAALQGLAELRMDGCGIVDWGMAEPELGRHSTGVLMQLTSLSLCDNPLSRSAVVTVCGMTQLRQLALSGMTKQATAAAASSRGVLGAAVLHAVGPAERAEQNMLHRASSLTGISPDRRGWFGVQAMPALTELHLGHNVFPEWSVAAFTQLLCPSLAQMNCLTKLDLSGCSFPHRMLRVLLSSLPASVVDVTLDRCSQVKRGDLQALALLPNLRRLSTASMIPGLRDKHAEVLSGLSSLAVLLMPGNDVGPKGLAMLLAGLQHLRELDIAGNKQIGHSGQAHVAAVRRLAPSQ